MNNKNTFNYFLYIWEKDYRSILQGTRTAFAVLCVIIIYLFVKDPSLFFMGICALGLCQSNARSLFWRFEINMLLSFLISTVALAISYPYSLNIISIYFYVFVLTFLIYIFTYFKIGTVFSLWVYLIPLYSILSVKSGQELIKNIYMNIIAFSICYFICIVLMPPKLRKECFLETKSILRELSFYIEIVENYTFDKSDKYSLQLTKRREKIFLRLQSLRLMMNDINMYRRNRKSSKKNDLLPYYIMSVLTERFIENTIGISIKIRLLNVPFQYEPVVRRLFALIHKTNNDMLKFLDNRKKYNTKELGFLYEKIYLDALVEVKKIEKTGQNFVHDELFNEIFSNAYQLKDNISLLNSEFKFLCKKE
jgi:hypothetical protein